MCEIWNFFRGRIFVISNMRGSSCAVKPVMIAKNWLFSITVDLHNHLVIVVYVVLLKGIMCCPEERCRIVTFAHIVVAYSWLSN